VATALAVVGCGTPSDSEQVRSTVELFAHASAQRDYATLCQRVLAPNLLTKLKSYNLPCPAALRQALGAAPQPAATVTRVTITARDMATALVRSNLPGGGQESVEFRLVKTPDGWRVSSTGRSPAPAGPPAGAPRRPSAPTTPND
jgi:hypothetical protein